MKLSDLGYVLGSAASFLNAYDSFGGRGRRGEAAKHRKAWAKKRLKACRAEQRGEKAQAEILRAEAKEHFSIARDLDP